MNNNHSREFFQKRNFPKCKIFILLIDRCFKQNCDHKKFQLIQQQDVDTHPNEFLFQKKKQLCQVCSESEEMHCGLENLIQQKCKFCLIEMTVIKWSWFKNDLLIFPDYVDQCGFCEQHQCIRCQKNVQLFPSSKYRLYQCQSCNDIENDPCKQIKIHCCTLNGIFIYLKLIFTPILYFIIYFLYGMFIGVILIIVFIEILLRSIFYPFIEYFRKLNQSPEHQRLLVLMIPILLVFYPCFVIYYFIIKFSAWQQEIIRRYPWCFE